MTKTHVVALGGSLLRPEESEKRQQWLGQLRQLIVHLEGILITSLLIINKILLFFL